jgi:hypothetical protein
MKISFRIIEAALTTAAVIALPMSAAVGFVVVTTLAINALHISPSRSESCRNRRDPFSLKQARKTNLPVT